MFYRNVQMRPLVYLPPPQGAVVLFDGSDLDAWMGKTVPARWRLVDGAMEASPGRETSTAIGGSETCTSTSSSRCPRRAPGAAEQDRD